MVNEADKSTGSIKRIALLIGKVLSLAILFVFLFISLFVLTPRLYCSWFQIPFYLIFFIYIPKALKLKFGDFLYITVITLIVRVLYLASRQFKYTLIDGVLLFFFIMLAIGIFLGWLIDKNSRLKKILLTCLFPAILLFILVSSFSENDLDPMTHLTFAGNMNRKTLDLLLEQARLKFDQQMVRQINQELEPFIETPLHHKAFYSALLVNFPFKWAFKDSEFSFMGKKVKGFGIGRVRTNNPPDTRAASQGKIYSYKDKDNFILTLESSLKDHILVLAKVPPENSLDQTIDSVFKRIYSSSPRKIREFSTLLIPVLDFKAAASYRSIASQLKKHILLEKIIQNIRFRLDKRGAILRATARVGTSFCIGKRMVFNRPFLLCMKYRNSKNPYFAVWVDNPDILIPTEK
jgi:hypothetical protein